VAPSEVSKLSHRQIMFKVIRISIPMILVLACALRGDLWCWSLYVAWNYYQLLILRSNFCFTSNACMYVPIPATHFNVVIARQSSTYKCISKPNCEQKLSFLILLNIVFLTFNWVNIYNGKHKLLSVLIDQIWIISFKYFSGNVLKTWTLNSFHCPHTNMQVVRGTETYFVK